MENNKLKGYDAIEYAEKHGLPLCKYTDPTEDAREDLTVEESRKVAREDPSLIYVVKVSTTKQSFELVFVGAAIANYIPRYRRNHKTLESAQATALRVWERMGQKGLPTACHAPIVYGPGCGVDGKNVQPW